MTPQLPDHFSANAELLKDRVILVTGATGGFGRAISKVLAAHGATVILLSKNVREMESLYDEIEAAGGPQPAIYPMNLETATEQAYEELATNISNEFPSLHGIIHCAAFLGAPTVFEQSDAETWYQVHQINLHAPYFITRACLPLLKQADHASVLFMVDDKRGAYWDAYQVSKRALQAMADLLAAEFDGSSVHINSFNPGKTRTGLQVRAYPAAESNKDLPAPDEHSNVFLYCMSPLCDQNGITFEA